MKSNLLHINMSKSCYMHFLPKKDKSGTCARSLPFRGNSDESNAIYLNSTPIKEVEEVKFLGVIIDRNLNWSAHVNYLVKKLRSATAIICRIRHCIPKENYLIIYHALFESHLTYGITVWGGIPSATMEKLFYYSKALH